IESVAVHQIETVLCRKTVSQRCESGAGILGMGDHKTTVHRVTFLVFDARNEPRLLRVMRMDGDGKTERRRLRVDALPSGTSVTGVKNSVVMLHPEMVRFIL